MQSWTEFNSVIQKGSVDLDGEALDLNQHCPFDMLSYRVLPIKSHQ